MTLFGSTDQIQVNYPTYVQVYKQMKKNRFCQAGKVTQKMLFATVITLVTAQTPMVFFRLYASFLTILAASPNQSKVSESFGLQVCHSRVAESV